MVACEAAVPGTPSNTDASVSLVVVTAYIPSRNAKAGAGSMPKVKGSRIAMPTRPDRPGTAPKNRPSSTPSPRYPRVGQAMTMLSPERTASKYICFSLRKKKG